MLIDPPSVATAAPQMGGTLVFLERALLLLPLLILSCFFAGTETALLSLTPAQREALSQKASAGDAISARLLWLLGHPRRLITTLILGNEVVNVTLSAFVTGLVDGLLSHVPTLTRRVPIPTDALVGLVATLGTVPLIIIFGELIPKTIAIKLAPRWARVVARPLLLVTWILWLPRLIISGIAGAVVFVIGGSRARAAQEPAPVLREQDFRTLVDMGSAEGEVEGTERRMIHNVFEFGDLTVGKVMTPAHNVFALSVDVPLARLVDAVSRQRYSRVPVYRGRKDNVVGILFAKDLVGYAAGDLAGRPLQDLLHPPLFVPRRAKCDRLLREFQRRRTHLALVVDEYGKLAGLVTMEDLLQSLFGDIGEPEPRRPSSRTMSTSQPHLTPVPGDAAAADAAAADAHAEAVADAHAEVATEAAADAAAEAAANVAAAEVAAADAAAAAALDDRPIDPGPQGEAPSLNSAQPGPRGATTPTRREGE